jgi:hypothetical protein
VAPDRLDNPTPLDDETVARAPVIVVPVAGPDLDDTVLTAGRASAPAAPMRHPAPAARVPAEPPAPRAIPRVRMPDGGVVEIEGGTVYVGRSPTLPRVPASGIPQLVAVSSPRREVSSTHLALSVVGGAVVVRDMLSTNGTVVKVPGVPARTLLRGESSVVTAGSHLDLGDGNIIEVLG